MFFDSLCVVENFGSKRLISNHFLSFLDSSSELWILKTYWRTSPAERFGFNDLRCKFNLLRSNKIRLMFGKNCP